MTELQEETAKLGTRKEQWQWLEANQPLQDVQWPNTPRKRPIDEEFIADQLTKTRRTSL